MIAGRPLQKAIVPSAVQAVAAGRPVQVVWENEIGGLTFAVGSGPTPWFVKWAPAGSGVDLQAEAARLAWAAPFTPVPEVLDGGVDEGGSWMVTSGLDGDSAVADRWKHDPRTAVRGIGAGLRAFHDALPVAACPWSWSADDRLDDARRRGDNGQFNRRRWHAVHQHLDIDEALARLAAPPPIDALVVCQGDACAPNTLLDDDGRCTGHVDLGALGVADRWADLAVATWSLDWNFGPGWQDLFLDAYEVAPDPRRTEYYRLLWDLGP
jgi:aminoglycoside phosphotransferase